MPHHADIHAVAGPRVADPLPIGKSLGMRTIQLDTESVRRQLVGIGVASSPLYASESARAEEGPAEQGTICPASALFYEVMEFPGPRDHELGRAAFNSGIQWQLRGILRVGQRLRLEGRVSDRWLKRGREYAMLEMSAYDEHDRCIAVGGFKESWDRPAEYDPPLETRDGAGGGWWCAPRGAELGKLACHYTDAMSIAFAGPLVNLHTDLDAARLRGFDRLVIAGPQIVAQISELMTRLFGVGFLEAGEIKINLLRPVLAGDTLTAYATAIEPEADLTPESQRQVALWSENQRGETVAGGSGSARV